ncbi:MAG: DUF1311 domain-containing protein [Acidobacteria bacterium]|nr:MAG: DUF1311 domain-containing protein [Acidobacteriota bacterium]
MTQLNVRRAPRTRLLTLVCLLFSPAAFVDEYPNIGSSFWDEDAEWYQRCMRVKETEPPVRDLPTAEATGSLAKCSATDLYYDTLDNPRARIDDWTQVRVCAFATNDTGVLMMLYANGFGVSRDPSIALKYACSTFSALAEMRGRVSYFADQLRDAGTADVGRVFDICDHITSGLGAGECMLIESRRAASRRRARLDHITNDWTEAQKNVLRAAEESLRAFADAHGIEETDYQGTAAAAFAIAAEEDEMELFLADIEKLEGGILPAYDQSQSQRLDDALHDLFESLMQPEVFNGSNGRLGYTTVAKEGLQKTQTAWLQYRDKWAAFGQARYPSVERYAWTAMITERRIKQLEGILAWVRPAPD